MIASSESIGRKRLMALHDDVEMQARDPAWERYFDMRHWFNISTRQLLAASVGAEIPVGASCGTAGCLLGHACSVPMLRDAGLSNRVVEEPSRVYPFAKRRIEFILNGEHKSGFEISEELFGISAEFHELIFAELGYDARRWGRGEITVHDALAQLRKVVSIIDKEEAWQI